jgi:SAM-dependent methyltransferase
VKKFISFLLRSVPRPILINISIILRPLVKIFYKGTTYQCPVCGENYRKFLPYGTPGGENRLCPGCLTLERHRLLWLFLKSKTNFFSENLKFLHLAPEQPFLKRFRAMKNLDYTTADLLSPIADVKTDIRDMNVFKDNTFDVVMCNHVLEHIDREQDAMKEILRVLKPNGFAILQVPIDYSLETTFEDLSITEPKEREKYFGQYDHVRQYGRDYAQRLESAGFNVRSDDFILSFSAQEIEKFRLDKQEIIYYCSKSQ